MKIFIYGESEDRPGDLNGLVRCIRGIQRPPRAFLISERDVKSLESHVETLGDVEEMLKKHFSLEAHIKIRRS